MHRFVIPFSACFIASQVHAANDHPISGVVVDEEHHYALDYSCREVSRNEIDCNMTHLNVSHAMTEGDVLLDIERVQKIYRDEPDKFTGLMEFHCARSNGKLKHETPEPLKTRWKEEAALWQKACKERTLELAKEIARLDGDNAKRRCRILTSNFTQTFNKTPEGTWAAPTDRTSACNIISIRRFEKASNEAGWTYVTRAISIGPQPDDLFQCKYIDEKEYRYRWDTNSFTMGCDEIGF